MAKTDKKELTERIVTFVKNMKGKGKLTHDEAVYMFNLYNEYYGTVERDYSCDLCAIRIYSKLEKISKSYGETKRAR